MKNIIKNKLGRVATIAAFALASVQSAKADAISEAVTELGDLDTAVAAGSAAIVAVALVFVGIKLGKRLLGKV